jgi:hypothetical protein
MDIAQVDQRCGQMTTFTTDALFHIFPEGRQTHLHSFYGTNAEAMFAKRAEIISRLKKLC